MNWTFKTTVVDYLTSQFHENLPVDLLTTKKKHTNSGMLKTTSVQSVSKDS